MIAALLITTALAAAEPAPAPPVAAPAAAAVGSHSLTIPTIAGAGEGKEVKPVLDTPHLKIATITLRKGTVLAKHASGMPVTILALQGAGHVVLDDGSKLRLDAGHFVALAPNVSHAVEPDKGTDLIVLVHHVKRAP